MKYHTINPELFTENRLRLLAQLKPNSLVVLNSNDIMPTNADGTMKFVQNSDLFYLSGIDQEESILLLFPDFPDESFREILFLRETSEEIAIWEGHKYTKDEATQTSGVERVMWTSQFEKTFFTLMAQAEHVYLNTNEHLRASVSVQTRDARFVEWCQQNYPLHQYQRLAPIMHQLRAIKSTHEIDLLQQACQITKDAFLRVLKFVQPGVMEYEIEAEYIHEFTRQRSRGFAYEPIIASGGNACVLHYLDNNQECKSGDLLLMDVGAEYANYNADMTRTIPVSGTFTDRQRAVYNAVLRVQREAMQLLRPGNIIKEYHKEVGKIMESELIGLGLLDRTDVKNQNEKQPLYRKYFMHGTSHHLGLDVHDVGNLYRKFEPGMVFTVEPGIYIREENMGIRLENNLVIREEGLTDLMGEIPIEADEIETLMNEK
ncbi:aminopeptidase P N-terminal domain-containing protein [Tunicatimonas pelagia]|uniref:aminopeptidase P N-terminal domain-containing protein n=1 Tax=Tunicatimonas pelagia TaxID=931531 RepID=UPI002665BF78|nr:aminopeptidase P N-terminal domain-containing protein [Tunicatimonas pelagia]WKN43132.1 aminopeptidase P N-terminal domain-containing protein [Tunicatimonas pelagia]